MTLAGHSEFQTIKNKKKMMFMVRSVEKINAIDIVIVSLIILEYKRKKI